MNTATYKGIIVAAGLIGAGTVWFLRSDSAHVHAIDAAELVAAAKDSVNELAGGSVTSIVCYSTAWEEDATITNQWGGYQSFDLAGAGMSGTYVFSYRTYGPLDYGAGCTLVGGAMDVYTNASPPPNTITGDLIDCGPGGAIPTGYYGANARNVSRSWYRGWSGHGFLSFTPAWYDLTNGFMWVIQRNPYDDFYDPITGMYHTDSPNGYGVGSVAISNPTYPTSGVSRIRYYSPHVLRTYTNTILLAFDEAVIGGIRASVAFCLNSGSQPCFIGPTNTGSTYDGVTSFPLVSSSGWRTAYTNWTQGGHSTTNYTTGGVFDVANIDVTYTNGMHSIIYGTGDPTYYTGSDSVGDWMWWPGNGGGAYFVPSAIGAGGFWYNGYSGPPCTLSPYDSSGNPTSSPPIFATPTIDAIVYTNSIAIPDESNFVKTNELAWIYSALYRLRDAEYAAVPFTNWYFYDISCSATTIAGAYAQVQSDFASGLHQGYGVWGNPGTWIKTENIGGAYPYRVTIYIQIAKFSVNNLYTNVSKNVEWYANVGLPAVAWQGGVFNAYGSPVSVTNVYKLVDTQNSVATQSVTSVYNSFQMPPLSDAIEGETVGYLLDDIVPVCRWQQRACTDAIFDGRYSP